MTRERGERRGLLGATSCHDLSVCDVGSSYKAIFVALGNVNIPKVIHASLYAGLQVLDLFALIKQDIKNISDHIY